jgi:hypothetical protein
MNAWREDADRVLSTVRSDDKLRLVADEYSGYSEQARDREEVPPLRGIDDIDGIVRRMCDEDMTGASMNRCVIERPGS